MELFGTSDRQILEYDIRTAGNKILANGNSLFTHPGRGGTGKRKITNVFSKSAFFNHCSGSYEKSTVINTGTTVEYWWHTNSRAHLSQTWTCFAGCFRSKKPHTAETSCRTPCGKYEDIILYKLPGNNFMMIVRHFIVITTNDCTNSANTTANNGIIEGAIAVPETSTEHIIYSLMAEPYNNIQLFLLRDIKITTFFEIAYCFFKNFLGTFEWCFLIKLNMSGPVNLRAIVCGNNICME